MAESAAITTTQAQAAPDKPNWITSMDAFTQSSSFRQLMILLALAAVLSFMVGFFLWGRSPALVPMYSNLDSAEANEVVQVLKESGYRYELSADGAIRVPPGKMPEIRMLLAEHGLPGGSGAGMEMLDEDMSLGTSQFMEKARYKRAIETELSRSIQTIRGVRAARVHLDEPEQSVFVRQERPTTASVVVDVSGSLSDAQVKGIVHLVASSVSGLSVENISVVDQSGSLLTNQGDDASGMGLTARQFEYQQNLERSYARRIESLLAPIVGNNKVRAQVSADIDFSRREGTSETFGPGEGVLLSEQLNEVNRALGSTGITGGVPGALTNQPPGGGVLAPGEGNPGLQAPENLTVEEFQELIQTTVDSNVAQTRNFNVDRQIEHVQFASGAISRLNVAVLLDDPGVADTEGDEEGAATGLAPEALERIEALVAQSVGLDMERGDQLTLSSFPFVAEELEPVETPIWEQAWFWNVLKNAGMGLAMLVVFLMVVRPLLKMLKENRRVERLPATQEAQGGEGSGGQTQGGQPQLGAQNQRTVEDDYDDDDLSNVPQLVGHAGYTDKLKQLRKTVEHDPKAVAAVVKQWTNAES